MYCTVTDNQPRRETPQEALYDACKAIVGETNGVVLRREGERFRPSLVAFWCSWRREVRPAFGATPQERKAVEEYKLTQ